MLVNAGAERKENYETKPIRYYVSVPYNSGET